MDSLHGAYTLDDVEMILEAMPTGEDAVGQTYDATLQRIKAQLARKRALAQSVIGWIVLSKRALTAVELQHAVGIRPHIFKYPKRNVTKLETNLGACLGLVSIDAETNVVRLVHYTAHEYFDKIDITAFPGISESSITQCCLTYLLVPQLAETVIDIHEDSKYSWTARYLQVSEKPPEDHAAPMAIPEICSTVLGCALHTFN